MVLVWHDKFGSEHIEQCTLTHAKPVQTETLVLSIIQNFIHLHYCTAHAQAAARGPRATEQFAATAAAFVAALAVLAHAPELVAGFLEACAQVRVVFSLLLLQSTCSILSLLRDSMQAFF